jgi:mannose-6-phosphate isomerase
MFVAITNTPRDYAWGSRTAIAGLLGRQPSGGPEAELWLGAHPGSPSRIIEPGKTAGTTDLAAWIEADPALALGGTGADVPRLPFLLKVLAAASPLSLQAHPTPEQAADGFARENAAGIPIDAPTRNYRDPFAKPELIYALSERFEALCGFRHAEDIRRDISRLSELDGGGSATAGLERWAELARDDDSLRAAFEWLISRGEGVESLISHVIGIARARPQEFPTIVDLAADYPDDPGVLISLMLNRVSLQRGEALYLPAGNIHAYLDGLGVELMTASDNVLRGGLTSKHIDVPELLSVLDFRPVAVPYLQAEHPASGVEVFRPGVPDFQLARISGPATLSLTGPAILVCSEGQVAVAGEHETVTVARGESLYVTPDESRLRFTGDGIVFVAMPG